MAFPAVEPPILAVSLAGLQTHASPAGAIRWSASLGFRAAALNAAAPGVRPRELSRSGRRDLASLLRRLDLRLAGLDLWIPPEHYLDSARSDRAIAAAEGAVNLAGELARLLGGPFNRPLVSLTLPTESGAEAVRESLAERCAEAEAIVADHAISSGGMSAGEPPAPLNHPIGIGLDPAAYLLAGRDPAGEASRLGDRLYSARLSDAASAERTPVGRGRLDRTRYLAALSAAGYSAPVILDLRGLRDLERSARDAIAEWGKTA